MSGVAPARPKQYFPTSSGAPLVNGTVDVYLAGTTTRTNTWQDRALSVLNTNPVVLDARGECDIWLDPAVAYKFVVKDSLGATVYTEDNVSGSVRASDLAGSNGSALLGFIQSGTGAAARTALDKMREVVSVKDFGAVGDGVANDQPAIQAAIDAVSAAGGGTVYFPAGTYKVVAKQRTSNPSDNHSYDGHPIIINASNVVLLGAGRENTTLQFRAYGDLSNAASWQVVSAQVFRGAGVFIRAGADAGSTVRNVAIRGLTLDGGAGYTGVRTFPANTGTGDGWDLTHKGVWLENDRFHDAITVADCTIRNFRGELVYQGGPNGGKLICERNELTSTNGDGFSSSAGNVVRHNRIHEVATAGVECAMDGPDKVYHGNEIYDCDKEGISISQGVATSRARIHDNVLRMCQTGILLTSPSSVTVELNELIDCGANPNVAINLISTAAAPAKDVTIRRNRIVCDTRSVYRGIAVSDSGPASVQNVRIHDNEVERTRAAVSGGFTITEGATFATSSVAPEFLAWNNAADSSFKGTQTAVTEETLLTGTGLTTVAERRPDKNRNFMVLVYVEVFNALTNLTLLVKWTGSDGVESTETIESAAAKAVGRYTYAPVFVHAYGSTDSQKVKIQAQAGTANNIKVSASILQVSMN